MATHISDYYINALEESGVICRDDRARKVTITFETGHVPTIHVERYGDDRQLSLIPALKEISETFGVTENG